MCVIFIILLIVYILDRVRPIILPIKVKQYWENTERRLCSYIASLGNYHLVLSIVEVKICCRIDGRFLVSMQRKAFPVGNCFINLKKNHNCIDLNCPLYKSLQFYLYLDTHTLHVNCAFWSKTEQRILLRYLGVLGDKCTNSPNWLLFGIFIAMLFSLWGALCSVCNI